MIASEIERHEY